MKAAVILFLFTFMMFHSCIQEPKEVSTFYDSGKLEHIKYFDNEKDTLTYYAKYFNEDGTLKCEGKKVNDKKTGKWKYYNSMQILKAIEKFNDDGLLTDTQIFYFSDGKIDRYKILDQPIPCFCDTQLHYGFTQIGYWRNGNLREINHTQNCVFDGKTQLYDSTTGVLYEEFFETMGQLNGPYKKFYADSSVMIGNYKDGQPVGKWKTIKDDKIISEKEY